MKTLRELLGVLLLVGVVSLLSGPAWARIGGGQHYSGSHSSSSSSRSSSSRSSPGFTHFGGSSSGTNTGGCGLCCMLLIVGVIVVAVVWSKKRQQKGGPGGGPSGSGGGTPLPPTSGEIDRWVEALKVKDPGFDLAALYQKAADIFVRSQKAWSDRELQPVRAFMSDATFQRFETQLALMRAQNVRNVTADQQVERVQLIGLEQNPDFDTVQLAIQARMRDVDVRWDTAEGDARSQAERAPDGAFTEIWSFVRKPGTRTDPGKDLLRGKCPNCGAPFSGGAANTCEYCGAIVNSGNYDWTLAEITQSEEAAESSIPPALEDIRREDPSFSLQILEDRVSLVFWKWIEARTFGEAGRVAKVATPELLHHLGNEVNGQPQPFRQCAVGAVITRNVIVGEHGTRALVEIRWSADTDGGDPTMKISSFVLARGQGAKTNAANGMATARCPNCNAPLTSTLSSHCDFCGTTLGGNPNEWLLSEVTTQEG